MIEAKLKTNNNYHSVFILFFIIMRPASTNTGWNFIRITHSLCRSHNTPPTGSSPMAPHSTREGYMLVESSCRRMPFYNSDCTEEASSSVISSAVAAVAICWRESESWSNCWCAPDCPSLDNFSDLPLIVNHFCVLESPEI